MVDRLVIRDGIVVDGTGKPAYAADLVIEGDTIVDVGVAGHVEGKVIDARGSVVSPGFIDLHSHADYSVLAFSSADSALRQGITTIAVGNCGGGVAPISEEHDIRPVSFAFRPEWGVDTSWRSFTEYMDCLGGLGVNVAALVPQGALRNAVMGVAARPASASELDTMAGMLAAAMETGAVGMSTGLQYRPGCWTPAGEIRPLVEIVGDHSGIYATHMRDRSENYVAAIKEAMRATRDTGAHLQLSHVVARPNAPAAEIESAHATMSGADGRFGVDTFPEPWGPGLLVDLFPTDLMEGANSEVLSRLDETTTRAEIEAYIDAGKSFLARVAGYGDIYLSWVPGRPELNGVSLADVGPVGSFCCEVLIEAGERMREVGIRHVYAVDSEIDRVLALPFCSVASDGIVTTGEDEECPLLWSASTYGYTARLLEHYVRERGFLTLEEAVRRMSSLPAEALGLRDRGTIAPGKRADLVVFRSAEIHDRSTPTAMARHPDGIDAVVVNGAIAFDGDAVSSSMAGRRVG